MATENRSPDAIAGNSDLTLRVKAAKRTARKLQNTATIGSFAPVACPIKDLDNPQPIVIIRAENQE